jgi:phosphatidate cytidylyltransferase
MFVTRLLTVALALPLVIAALVLLPQQLWALVLLPVLAIASWEWAGLANYPPGMRVSYTGCVVLSAVALFYLVSRPPDLPVNADLVIYGVSCAFWLVVAPLWLALRWTTRNRLLLAIAGWVALVPMWLALVQLQSTPWTLLIFLSIVWVADTAAYLAGKRWGQHKLAPRISPGKTWEGLAGACAAVAIYYIVLFVAGPMHTPDLDGWWGPLVFGAILALSVEGDLFESWAKRSAGVKDSGQLLPGHGGILDRIDGLTATMPVAALALFLR